MTTTRTRNAHGRTGVHRRRPTTNQELRARNAELERSFAAMTPTSRANTLHAALEHVAEMTAKSKTGVAHKVNEFVTGFLGAI